MEKIIAAVTLATGAALIVGALVQVYYSDLPPLAAWSAPAMSFVPKHVAFSIGLWSFARH
jgi:hypothetical protein